MTGGHPRKAGAQIGQKGFGERTDVPNGQGETGPGDPREPERVRPGGCQPGLQEIFFRLGTQFENPKVAAKVQNPKRAKISKKIYFVS